MQQDKVSKLSDVRKNAWDEDRTSGKNVKPEYKPSYGERWDKAQASKTVVFWISVAVIILTIIVGFTWGGWVTSGTAQRMANEAIIQRLSSICVGQFNQDPQKDQKLTELQAASRYQRDAYVKEQGWATMPGEQEPNRQVTTACTQLIVQINQ
jgi:hypothetical protein